MNDPKRLSDDPRTSPVVRDTLALARRATVAEYDAGKGLERFLAATAPAAAVGAGAWALPRLLRFLLAKWFFFGVVGVAAVGGTTYAVYEHGHVESGPRTAPPAAAAAPATVAPPATAAPPAPPTPTTEAPPDVPAAPMASAATSGTGAPSRSHAHTKVSPDERVAREVRLLGRARTALASDPAEALALTQESQREFPQGVLSEEREAIAILALSQLGRTREAQARGKAFLGRFPNGPFSAKVRLAVDPPDPGPSR